MCEKQIKMAFRAPSPLTKTVKPNKSKPPNAGNTTITQIPVDLEEEAEDAYNDYLLAMMNNSIIKTHSERIKTSLSDQLAIQREALYEDKLKLQKLEMEVEIKEEIKKIEVTAENLRKQLTEFHNACERKQFEKSMQALLAVLSGVKNRVVLQNVSVDDDVVKNLDFVSAELDKILMSSGDVNQIREVAEKLQTTLSLKEDVIKRITESEDRCVELVALIMKTLSNYYAEKYVE